MTHALAFLIVALPGTYVLVEGFLVLRTPTRWPSRTNRWIVSLRMADDPRPSRREIRFWGGIWVAIGLVILGFAAAALLAA
jgi:hypothetical protein